MNIGDKYRIVNNWLPPEAKAKTVSITKVRKDGMVEVRWCGTSVKDYPEKFGMIFPPDELRKI